VAVYGDKTGIGSGINMDSDIKHLKETSTAEILSGLKQKQKSIPPKYFYDARGSELFSRICNTEEYYPTRTEEKILRENISEISEMLGRNILLVEFGSGSSRKTRILLEGADITGYIPIDISHEHLMESVNELKDVFPDLKIYPMPADYSREIKLPETNHTFDSTAVFFPGSTIGNFSREEAEDFFRRVKGFVSRGGMLLGFDLIKDKRILERAYNDRDGITAEFNLNILDNINSLTGSDFDKNNFEHLAFYNEDKNRIEMHLISRKDQVVKIGDEKIKIAEGENIITEYSYKYRINDIRQLIKKHFTIKKVWTDKNKFFAVAYLAKN
jgi:dimethylhistidine N-methyltransferase